MSTASTVEVNGRPALTITDVQSWCQKVSAPTFSDDGASKLAGMLNYALLFSFLWKPEFSALRKENASTKRLLLIADALAVLQGNLPQQIADERRALGPDATLPAEGLLAAVNQHSPLIDWAKRQRSRRAPHNNLAANIGREIDALWTTAGDATTKKARDAFVALSMEWLGTPASNDDSVGRNRRRRATTSAPNRHLSI